MKFSTLTLALSGALAACIASAATAQLQHEHAARANDKRVAVPTTRWASDAPLRKGMSEIRNALDELRHFEMGHMPAALALQRVTAIQHATTYLFAHCVLAPDADVALHGMLVPLLSAAHRFEKDTHDVSAVAAMRSAVADYPRYFDDPQWPIATDAARDTH